MNTKFKIKNKDGEYEFSCYYDDGWEFCLTAAEVGDKGIGHAIFKQHLVRKIKKSGIERDLSRDECLFEIISPCKYKGKMIAINLIDDESLSLDSSQKNKEDKSAYNFKLEILDPEGIGSRSEILDL